MIANLAGIFYFSFAVRFLQQVFSVACEKGVLVCFLAFALRVMAFAGMDPFLCFLSACGKTQPLGCAVCLAFCHVFPEPWAT